MTRYDLQVFRNLRLQTPEAFTKDPVPGFSRLEAPNITKKPNPSIDITKLLGSSTVTFEETDQGTDQLTFTIKHAAAVFIEKLSIGTRVEFRGGYNIERRDGTLTKKGFFNGFVSQRRPKVLDNGRLELEVVAEDALFLLSRNKPGTISYPSKIISGPMHNKNFHFKDKMKLSDIIRGIIKEYSIPIKQISIDEDRDLEFTQARPFTQTSKESDLEFLTRIMTGRSKDGLTPAKKKEEEEKLVNARARMFMEWDAEERVSKFNVLPESKLLGEAHFGGIFFQYHAEGGRLIPVREFDPTRDPSKELTRLIMSNVQIKENADKASREIQRGQDVGSLAKLANQGSQLTEEIDDPYFLENWEVNEALVAADEKSVDGKPPILPKGTIISILRGEKNWDDYKRYFFLRTTVFEPTSRNLTNKPEETETPSGDGKESIPDGNVIGHGSGGEGSPGTARSFKVRQKRRIKQYGEEISFTCHGNIFALCRKSYSLIFPIGYYTGDWYCFKIVHKFGPTYKMDITVGR